MPHIIVAAGIFYVLEMTLYSFAGNFAHLFSSSPSRASAADFYRRRHQLCVQPGS